MIYYIKLLAHFGTTYQLSGNSSKCKSVILGKQIHTMLAIPVCKNTVAR